MSDIILNPTPIATASLASVLASDQVLVKRYAEFASIWEAHERAHWIPDEADMRMDTEQWKNGTINEAEKRFIKMVLRLFTQADKDVQDAYVDKLLPRFQASEVRHMLVSFTAREATHQLGYRRLNDTLGYDSQAFMEEFLQYAEMKDKHEFMVAQVPLDTPTNIALYLAKQTLMEGVNLFASFVMLLSFAPQGKLPGMVSVNKWSVADETYHVMVLAALFRKFLEENPQVVNNHFKAEIYETARRVIALEDAFVDLVYSVGDTSAVTKEQVKAYVRYVCDYRMQQLGLKAQFGVKENPVDWMDKVLGKTLVNFFEVTGVEYSKGNLVGDWVY
jgi:ribonucleoside-diphosphate reductase beta chain